MSATSRTLLALPLALPLLLASRPAFAQSDADLKKARAEFVQGQKDYAHGDFQKALDEYNDVLDVKSSASVLFNLAQTHRQLSHLPQALFFYKQVVEDYPTSDEATQSKSWITKLESQSVVATGPNVPASAPTPVVVKPPVPTSAPVVVVAPKNPPGADLGNDNGEEGTEETPIYEQWWFIGGGAVVVAGGVAAALLATRDTRTPSGSWGLLTPASFGAR